MGFWLLIGDPSLIGNRQNLIDLSPSLCIFILRGVFYVWKEGGIVFLLPGDPLL